MSFTDLPVFKALAQRITTLSFRQGLLARNLAHIQTPHQKALDIDPKVLSGSTQNFKQAIELKKTNTKHISSQNSTNTNGLKITTSKDKDQVTIQGNNISLDDQLQKVEETRLAHQVATMLYRKNHDLIRAALQSKG